MLACRFDVVSCVAGQTRQHRMVGPVSPARRDAAGNAAAKKTAKRSSRGARKLKPGEYSIDALARAAETTVRNVRAYQDRGLLPSPERRGRIGIYSDDHLARLRLIGRLLERGYTLANIGELVVTWQQGRKLEDLLGLESELTRPWSRQKPMIVSPAQLAKMLGGPYKASDLARAIRLGLVERNGARFHVPNPKLLAVGNTFTRMGVPVRQLLDVVAQLRSSIDYATEEMVGAAIRALDQYGDDQLPPAGDVPKLAETIKNLRAQVDEAVQAEISSAIEDSLGRFLGSRLSAVLDHLHTVTEEA